MPPKAQSQGFALGKTVACPKCALKIFMPAPAVEEADEVPMQARAEPAATRVQVRETTEEKGENEVFQSQIDDAEVEPPEPPELAFGDRRAHGASWSLRHLDQQKTWMCGRFWLPF
jgi:hypothetical protein